MMIPMLLFDDTTARNALLAPQDDSRDQACLDRRRTADLAMRLVLDVFRFRGWSQSCRTTNIKLCFALQRRKAV